MEEKEFLSKIYKIGKAIIWLLIAILLVLVIGVSKLYSSEKSESSENEEQYNTNYDVSTFKEISADDIKAETKGQARVIYIGRETCSWCAAFLPNLWDAEEDYDYETLYIDIAKIIDFTANTIIDEEAYATMISLTGDGYESYVEEKFGSTPMILIVKDNKIIGAQTGYSDYDTFTKVLEKAGFKEN